MHIGPPLLHVTSAQGGSDMSCLLKPLPEIWKLHKPLEPPSPKTNHLPPQGGPEYYLSPKNHFFPIFLKIAHFCLFNMSSSEADSGQMKMNFENLRDFFLHNRLNKKTLSQFLHRCQKLGESKPSSSPIFSVFHFFYYSPDFSGAISVRWR
jgi:hypothetical protein